MAIKYTETKKETHNKDVKVIKASSNIKVSWPIQVKWCLFVCSILSFVASGVGLQYMFNMEWYYCFGIAFILQSIVVALYINLVNMYFNPEISNLKIGFYIVFLTTFAFAFSTSSMYNSLLFNLNGQAILKEEVRSKQTELTSLVSRSNEALKITYANYENQIKEIENLTIQLERQITDKFNGGFGEQSKKILKQIEEKLGTSITQLSTRGSSHAQIAKQYSDMIKELSNSLIKPETKDVALKQIQKNNTYLASGNNYAEYILVGDLSADQIKANMQKLINNINSVGFETKAIIDKNHPDAYTFTPAKFINADIGTYAYFFDNALPLIFSKGFIAFMLAVAIDNITWLMILFINRPNKPTNQPQPLNQNNHQANNQTATTATTGSTGSTVNTGNPSNPSNPGTTV